MTTLFQVDPSSVFTTTNDGTIEALSTFGSASVGTARTIVSAVSGKKIKLLGWNVFSTGTITIHSYFVLKAGSSALVGDETVDGNTICKKAFAPVLFNGYGETAVNQALNMDVVGTDVIYTIYYFIYTP